MDKKPLLITENFTEASSTSSSSKKPLHYNAGCLLVPVSTQVVSSAAESSSLFLMHDSSKDSTAKLEWKSSPYPFIFGSFGFMDPPFSCNLKTEEGKDELCCDLPPPSTLQHLKEIASQIDTNNTRILSIDGEGTTTIVTGDALINLEDQIYLLTSDPHAQIADSFEIVIVLEERPHGHHFSVKKEWVLPVIKKQRHQSRVEDARKLFDMMPVKDVIVVFYFTRKSGLEVLDIRFDEHASKVVLPQGLVVPVNSFNTLFHSSAFWTLMLLVSVSTMVSDVLRGYRGQRLLWEVGGYVVVYPPTVHRYDRVEAYPFSEEKDLHVNVDRLISREGIGDNDYSFAIQHVVLPIGSEFALDFTIISVGFDAARGDPLCVIVA
ncbi:Ureohydrolase domain superfamily [Sesbania bispinosa]|nr:Ureohydrolase domain superfamily [Sesbania bispinosa]